MQLNVYSSLEGLGESDNDIKSIIIEQLHKYRHVTVRIKKSGKSNERFAVLTFDNLDSLDYFKRSILERRDRVVVYDRVLFFNFNRNRLPPHRQREYRRVSPSEHSYRDRNERSQDARRQTITVSRTLFVGNLDDHTETSEIRRMFEPYGELLDVVIKHPRTKQGAPYSFVKFRKLSSAVNAREQLQDLTLGGKRLKIGYGKVPPGHALWVGGLNEQTNEEELFSEVRRAARFANYDFRKEDNIAYFVFETIAECQSAHQFLQNSKLVHSGAKLEVDYADSHAEVRDLMDKVRLRDTRRDSRSSSPVGGSRRYHPRSPQRSKVARRSSYSSSSASSRRRSPRQASRRSRSASPVNVPHISLERKLKDSRNDDNHSSNVSTPMRDRPKSYEQKEDKIVGISNTLLKTAFPTLVSVYPVVWKGSISVKTNVCPAHLHLVCGSVDPVSTMVHQATLGGRDATHLQLTKRFSLLPDRVAELRAKLATSIATRDCCILIAQPSTDPTSAKALIGLAAYFQQKQAAGIGSVGSTSIYAFPPSPFTQEQLSTLMPHAISCLSAATDNYLMVVISR